MSTPETFTLPGGQFITVTPGTVRGAARVESNLKVDPSEDGAAEWNAAIDGLEALLLAMAGAGVDLSTSEYRQAVETAVEGLANHYA